MQTYSTLSTQSEIIMKQMPSGDFFNLNFWENIDNKRGGKKQSLILKFGQTSTRIPDFILQSVSPLRLRYQDDYF